MGVEIPNVFHQGREHLMEFIHDFAIQFDKQMQSKPDMFKVEPGYPYYMMPHRHTTCKPLFQGQIRINDGTAPLFGYKSIEETKQDYQACLAAIKEARKVGDSKQVELLEKCNVETVNVKHQLQGAYMFARMCGLFLNEKEEAIRKRVVEDEMDDFLCIV